MRVTKMLFVVLVLAVGGFGLGPAVALAAAYPSQGPVNVTPIDYGSIQGRLTVMDSSTMMIQVRGQEATGPGSLHLALTGQTTVHQGIERKSISDVKVGQEVLVRYDRQGNKLVATNVDILQPLVARAHYFGRYLGEDQHEGQR